MVFGVDDLLNATAGLFGLGGGGGKSAAASYGIVSTIQGGDKDVGLDQTLTHTLQGGENPLALTSTIQGGTADVGIDLGLDDVNIDLGGTATPLHTITELRHPDTFKSETDIDLDVQPVQVDLCVNVGLTKLPKARIRQPYDSHFGVNVLGVELIDFNWRGVSDVIIDELDPGPHIEPNGAAHRPHAMPPPHKRRSREYGPPPGRGFRVRIN